MDLEVLEQKMKLENVVIVVIVEVELVLVMLFPERGNIDIR